MPLSQFLSGRPGQKAAPVAIGPITAILSGALATLAIALSAILLHDTLQNWREAQRQRVITSAIALLGKGLVDLSLERSLAQVSLNLPDPMPPPFRAIIDNQRQAAAASIGEALGGLTLVGTAEALRVADYVGVRLATLDALRREVDRALEEPADSRDPSVLARWSSEVPRLISDLERRRNYARGPADQVPLAVAEREAVQHLAWAVREYGGRERTLFAIALAQGTAIPAEQKARMATMDETVRRRLDSLAATAEQAWLDEGLRQDIEYLVREYEAYRSRLRGPLLATDGQGFPVTFEAYFQESSRVLDLAAALSQAAAAANIAYWQDSSVQARLRMLLAAAVGLAALGLASGLVFFVRRRVSRPAGEIALAIEAVAGGDLSDSAPVRRPTAEIARIASALSTLRERLAKARQLEAATEAERALRARRQAATEAFTADFSRVIGGVLDGLGRSATHMQDSARSMADLAGSARADAQEVNAATERAATTLDQVAEAAERLLSEAEAAAQQVSHASDQVGVAVAEARDGTRIIIDLSQAASEIGGVLETIRDIAGQTGLLALNATIEAARAGEAGKGFAVVAGEVKALAARSASATRDVATRIEAVQNSAAGAAASVARIAASVEEMRVAADEIAAGIAAQREAVQAISSAVRDVAGGTGAVRDRMGGLAQVAAGGGEAARAVLNAADGVRTRSEALRKEVEAFLAAIERAGDRRRFDRHPCRIEVRLRWSDGEIPATMVDISVGGALLEAALEIPVGSEVMLLFDGDAGARPPIPARVARTSPAGTGLLFIPHTAADRAIEAVLHGLGVKAAA